MSNDDEKKVASFMVKQTVISFFITCGILRAGMFIIIK